MDFQAPQFQHPDILGSYLRGQQAPYQLQNMQQQGIINQQQIDLGNQKQEQNSLTLEQMRTAMGQQQQIQALRAQLEQGQQGQGDPAGGTQNLQQAPQNGYDPSAYSVPDVPQPILDPRTQLMIGGLSGGKDLVADVQTAYKQQMEQRTAAMEQAKLQAAAPLALLDQIHGSHDPKRVVQMNPGLMQRWNQLAPQMGMDPVNDFTDDNVRTVLEVAGNGLRTHLGMAPKEYGFTGNLSGGQTHYENGRAVVTAPQDMTPYQQKQIDLENKRINLEMQRLAKEEKPTLTDVTNADGTVQKKWVRPGESDGVAVGGASVKPQSENDKKVAVLYGSMIGAERDVAKANKTDSSSYWNRAVDFPVLRTMQSDAYRQYESAGLRFAANLLYIKSGATATPDEIRSTWKQFFPQPGDGKEAIKQKNAARLEEIRNVSGTYKLDIPEDMKPKAEQPAGGEHPADIQEILNKLKRPQTRG